MKAIILVGGEGTRLRPLTYSIVKSMVPVLNRPFLEHVICRLARHDIKDIILAMGYKPDSIYEYFKKGPLKDVRLSYSLEVKPMGTAGAVKLASEHIRSTFFVLNGDVFTDIDYTGMLQYHLANKSKATIALTHVDDPTKFGVVETENNGRVRAFIEKPPADRVTSHWINAGVYVLEPEILDYIPDDEFYMFERGVFPRLLQDNQRVFAYPSSAYWIDMGTPAKYKQLNNDIITGRCSSFLYDASSPAVGEDTVVSKSCRIEGPVLIGKNCQIGEHVRLVGPLVIGNNCHIKMGCLIENSLLWNDIRVGINSSVINSVIANGAIIDNGSCLMDQIYNHEANEV